MEILFLIFHLLNKLLYNIIPLVEGDLFLVFVNVWQIILKWKYATFVSVHSVSEYSDTDIDKISLSMSFTGGRGGRGFSSISAMTLIGISSVLIFYYFILSSFPFFFIDLVVRENNCIELSICVEWRMCRGQGICGRTRV